MPGTRCAVASCNNSSVASKKDPEKCHIIYHMFPKNDFDRQAIWINKCRRKTSFNPATSFICSSHFLDEDYERNLKAELLNIQPKKILNKTAIPSLNLGIKTSVSDALRTQQRQSRIKKREMHKLANDVYNSYLENNVEESKIEPVVEPMAENNERLIKKRKNCDSPEEHQKLIKIWQTRYSKMKEKHMKKTKEMNALRTEKNRLNISNKQLFKELKRLKRQNGKKQQLNDKCSEILHTVFSKAQVNQLMGKKMVVWSTDDLTKAFTLFHFSKQAYLYVKNELKIPLPGLSTLRRYASKTILGNNVLDEESDDYQNLVEIIEIQNEDLEIILENE